MSEISEQTNVAEQAIKFKKEKVIKAAMPMSVVTK